MKPLTLINLMLGIGLMMASHAASGGSAVTRPSMANDAILGAMLIASSLWILASPVTPTGAGYFQTLIGCWLIVTPVLAYGGLTPGRHDLIAGVVVMAVGLAEVRAISRRTRLAA